MLEEGELNNATRLTVEGKNALYIIRRPIFTLPTVHTLAMG